MIKSTLLAWQVKKVNDYIAANLSEVIEVEQLAALVNYGESHFSRAFRNTYGETVQHYIRWKRMDMAKTLLLTTSESIGTIALCCGMCDQSHFTRVFKRVVGYSPCAWRHLQET